MEEKNQMKTKKILLVLIPIILITGCIQTADSTHVTIKELNTHPNQYIGKTVTITAPSAHAGTTGSLYSLYDNGIPSLFAIITNQTIRPDPLIDQATYTYTGTVRYGTVFTGSINLENTIYLEAIKITS